MNVNKLRMPYWKTLILYFNGSLPLKCNLSIKLRTSELCFLFLEVYCKLSKGLDYLKLSCLLFILMQIYLAPLVAPIIPSLFNFYLPFPVQVQGII